MGYNNRTKILNEEKKSARKPENTLEFILDGMAFFCFVFENSPLLFPIVDISKFLH